MRLGIDTREALDLSLGRTGGVSQFVTRIAEALGAIDSVELVKFDSSIVSTRLPFIRSHVAFARAVDRAQLDWFFSPSGLLPFGLKTRAAVFIHDLIIFDHPEWFPDSFLQRLFTLKFILPWTVRKAERIFVPSEFVRASLVKRFPRAASKVYVVPEGVCPPNSIEQLSDECRSRWQISDRYILSVSTFEPRKNFLFAINIVAPLLEADPLLQFVIVGRAGWGVREVHHVADKTNQQLGRTAVRCLHDVSETEKWTLYKNAELFLGTSLAEGFYLPPFEAMAVGTPVVTTIVGAIPDLAVSTVALISLDNPSAATEIIQNRLKAQQTGISRGFLVNNFTWKQTAQKIIQRLEK